MTGVPHERYRVGGPRTLTEVLAAWAEAEPERPVFTFLRDGEQPERSLDFGELERRSLAIAQPLAAACRRGDRALLLFHPGLDFIAAFFACLRAGVVAVPAYPPRSRRMLPRLQAIARDCAPAVVLTTSEARPRLLSWCRSEPAVAGLPWIAVDDETPPGDGDRRSTQVGPEDLAFLQYTSGSTGTPKGVMVTHGNLLHNQEVIREACGHGPDSVFVSWLPVYHDLGLIGQVLQAVYTGARCVLMAPVAFLQRPLRWLEAVSRFGATTSGGPNFAYDLCVDKCDGSDLDGLDLSSWRVAFNGAEPVRESTLARFAERFAPHGFRRTAFYPCYGLAEATLMVTGGSGGEDPVIRSFVGRELEAGRAVPGTPPLPGTRALVGCGRPLADQVVEVVGPESRRRLGPGEIGEVWVAGPSVARGYWERSDATRESFGGRLPGRPERFLRTGDLGFLLDGELYLAGRLKDLIIVRGRNLYPQDLELTSERSHPAARSGCAAAFSVDGVRGERLVLVQEVARDAREPEAIAAAIRRAVALEHEVHVHDLVLVKPGRVPRTTSGKVQRSSCRDLFLRGALEPVSHDALDLEEEGGWEVGWPEGALRQALAHAERRERAPLIEEFLRSQAARLLRTDPARLGAEEPLVSWGLDSLAVAQLKHLLELETGVPVHLGELLEDGSVAAVARSCAARFGADVTPGTPTLEPGPRDGSHPLSWGQRSLWFLHHLAPTSAAYHIAGAASLPRGVDPERLRRAFQGLVNRHDVLRTALVAGPDGPVQRVAEHAEVDFVHEDGRSWDGDRLERRLDDEVSKPFDLGTAPPLRVVLVDRPEESLLLLVVHHVAADFLSLAVLVRELGTLYEGDALPPPPEVAYTDFARWQERMLRSSRGERLWTFWRGHLAGAPDLELPSDRPRPPVAGFRGGTVSAALPPDLTAAVHEAAERLGSTPFVVLASAYQALLSRRSGQTDFVVGTPTAGRVSPRLDRAVGYFVNPVALRVDLADDPRADAWLERTRAETLRVLEHQDFPFALLAERLQPVRDPARHPVFQSLLAFQRAPDPDLAGLTAFALGRAGARLRFGELSLESRPLDRRAAQLDLALLAGEHDGELLLSVEYDADLFDATTGERLARQFGVLLRALLEEPASRISQLPLMTAAERHQVSSEWSSPAGGEAPAASLDSLVRARAAVSPEALAIEDGSSCLTYGELAGRAAAVARVLRGDGIGRGDRVALLVPRSLEMVVAVLGILETGASYVPLDPDLPARRIACLLDQSRPQTVLATGTSAGLLPEGAPRRLLPVDRTAGDDLPEARGAGPEDVAYVLFTSGSTGVPKAVAVPHRGVVNRLLRAQELHRLTAADAILQKTPLGFDFSVWEIFAPLLAGARLVVARPGGHRDPEYLAREMTRRRVTLVHFVPSMWEAFLGGVDAAAWRHSLRQAFAGGEALPADLAERVAAQVGVPLENQYGPTEASIDFLWHHPGVREPAPVVPLGRPIGGCRVHLLGPRLDPVPVGVPAEICVGGLAVAQGYVGRPARTAAVFVPRPRSGLPGERLYRTGDLARFRSDGVIEYLGRIDAQVKVRGVRVEPGEVEALLRGQPGVLEAAVVARQVTPGDVRLVAYVVPDGADPDPAALREALRERLPEVLVPSRFAMLRELPLTPSGKLDRRALPPLSPDRREPVVAPPETATQRLLADLWSDLLGLGRVGLRDHFFDLGGHSILATRLAARAVRSFGRAVPVAAVFRHPVLEDLAAAIDRLDPGRPAEEAPPLRPMRFEGAPRASYAQERLWLVERLGPAHPAYNLPAAVRLRGPVVPELLRRSFEAVVERHEPLRTTFRSLDGVPVQEIAPGVSVPLPRVDLTGLVDPRRYHEALRLAGLEAARPFDVERGPVLRITLVRLAASDHLLLVTLHHFAADGWSLGILVQELSGAYRAGAAGLPLELPRLPVRYADYAAWQRRWLEDDGLEPQLAWWRERLAGVPTVVELPTDRTRPPVRSFRGGLHHLELDPDLAEGLRSLGRQLGTTPFMTLLAIFQALLARYTGLDRIPVGAPIANRQRIEVQGLVGLFVNMLVLAPDLGGDPCFDDLAGRVRELVLGAHLRQDVPFEKLVEELAPRRSLSVSPLVQVTLAVESDPLPSLDLPEVETEHLEPQGIAAKFDLSLTFRDVGPALRGTLEYARDLFDAPTVDRLVGHLRALAEAVVSAPEHRLSELPLLSEAERRQLRAWTTGGPGDRDAAPAHHAVLERADRQPDRLAMAGDGWSLSYGELAACSRRLAARLHRLGGLDAGAIVGVLTGRSADLAVAALAALEAGAAYLPLDPAYPPAHNAYVLADAGAVAVVVAPTTRGLLPPVAAPVLGTGLAGRGEEKALVPPSRPSRSALAYVIYTSGSTGRPKGVEVTHGGLANLVAWHLDAYGLSGDDRTTLLAGPAFDASVWELWAPLAAGATIEVPEDATRADPRRLLDWMAARRVTSTFLPTPLAEAVVEEAERQTGTGEAASLHTVLTGGDRLHRPPPEGLAFALVNHYGPTESTVVTTAGVTRAGSRTPPAIGRPIAGLRVQVVDVRLRRLPVGVPGELCVAGAGLARGYRRRRSLTAAQLVPDPWGPEPGGRLYRTGDLVRWLPDGTLDFLGRLDSQVKVRGFRIELGEVEAVLREQPAVAEAAVIADLSGGSDPRLVAYVVPAAEAKPGEVAAEALRRRLRRRLPAHMLPEAVVVLGALPLTPNGKLDRNALPASRPQTGDVEEGPRTPSEEVVAAACAELLGRERVGVHQDFFDLGGHSLLAARLVARLRDRLGVELPLAVLFERSTVAGIAASIEEFLGGSGGEDFPPLRPVPRDRPLPPSFAQERLWFLDRLEPESAIYNLPAAVALRGDLDLSAWGWAVRGLVRRHETLRTLLRSVEGRPVQVVLAAAPVALPLVDLSRLPRTAAESESDRIRAAEARRPFDLSASPPLRTTLLRLAGDHRVLLVTFHHVAADAWSVGVFVRELAALYRARVTGEPAGLRHLPVQYADYAVWQRERLRGERLDRALDWWREHLAGAPSVAELPLDRPRPARPTYRGGAVPIRLDPEVVREVTACGRRRGATLFMVLLAALQATLARLTGQLRVVVGTPVANRGRLELEGLIGFFVNTLAIQGDLSEDPRAEWLIERARSAALGALAHQDLPFERLVEETVPERDLAQSPLFQVMLALNNAPGGELALPGVVLARLPAEEEPTKFDLDLALEEEADGALRGDLRFARDLFDRTTAQRILRHLEAVLAAMVRDPRARLSALPLLSAAEAHALLREWSGDRRAAPRSVHRQIADQAERVPDAVAVTFQGRSLTYGELRHRSVELAGLLRARGVGPEARVALLAERSADMVTALLGVLEAGAAYVPLDPTHPTDRLELQLQDAGATTLVSRTEWLARHPRLAAAVQDLVLLDERSRDRRAAGRLPGPVEPEGLAYVIYTSGSTGRPKGVAVEHRQLASYVAAAVERLDLAGRMSFATVSTLAADLGHTAVFPALVTGGTLHVVSGDRISDREAMAHHLASRRIDVLKIVPSHLAALAAGTDPGGALPARRLVLGGEASELSFVRALSAAGQCRIDNHYGPTETTVGVATLRLAPGTSGAPPRGSAAPVGRPLPGSRLQVLGRGLRPVPIGVAGELCIGGSNVSRGYLGSPGTTAERFVPDPEGSGERLYRSGDLARVLRDGIVEFLGRIDGQVKVRGFRVEPGEVVAALRRHPAIGDAFVTLHRGPASNAEAVLVAYVVPAGPDGAPPPPAALRRHLAGLLPGPAVPSLFVPLTSLPLTTNGKVDRRRLPDPRLEEAAPGDGAPRGLAEELVAAAWRDLLELESISAERSFFELGGHSLLATRLVSRLRRDFRCELPLRAVFEAPTVRGLAARLDEELRAGGELAPPPIVAPAPEERPAEPPLSWAQERLWFLDRLEPGGATYNLPYFAELRGALDAAALARAVTEIARRHEALRTSFPESDGGPVQRIAPPGPLRMPVVDLSGLASRRRRQEARRLAVGAARLRFDLARGPLVRMSLVRLDVTEHHLLLALHHIVSDAWSRGVLGRELGALYEASRLGRRSPLPALRLQYADFALWQRRHLQGATLERLLRYWRGCVAPHEVLELPADRPRGTARTPGRGGSERLDLPAGLAAAVDRVAASVGATRFMVLLGAFQALLARLSGADAVSVGTPVSGREHPELEGLIGFFVNTVVLRVELADDPSFAELVERVRGVAVGAYSHQDLPFERLVEELDPDRHSGRTPLFQVAFAFQDASLGRFELPELEVVPIHAETGSAKFDLTLSLVEGERGAGGSLEYRADLFDPTTVRRLGSHYLNLLEAASAAPAVRLSELSVLSAAERWQVLGEWRGTVTDGPVDTTAHALVRRVVERTPDRVAVDGGSVQLSYRELWRRAERLADRLRALGVGLESPVGVAVERSVDLVVALLAVVETGGHYVPLDPAYPEERLTFMIEDARIEVLVTRARELESLPATFRVRRGAVVLLDGDAADAGATDGAAAGRARFHPDQLAYVMYTSGSTGLPKGVAVSHRGIVRLIRRPTYARLGPDDVVLHLAPVSFDASTFEVWAPLATGSRLAVHPGREASFATLGEVLARHRVTTLWLTAGLFHQVVDEHLDDLAPVRCLLAGGDVLSPAHVQKVLARLPGTAVVNGYGPTENTTFTACHRMTGGTGEPADPVPVGRPIADTEVRLLDPGLRPVPTGVPGELFAGGAGLARGYSRRPRLTADAFVPDPLASAPGARLYRTGDLARWLPEGTLEFMGRIDQQVKVRGFRIEPGEVEAALLADPRLTAAVVLARDDLPGGRALVAYVVTTGAAGGGAAGEVLSGLRDLLRRRLPEFMVPAFFVPLPELPLTPNGKVDRKALRAIDPRLERGTVRATATSPSSPEEELLAYLWAEVLGLGAVGPEEDFFDLGGHSLLATRIVSRIRSSLGVELPVAALFDHPTVRGLASAVAAAREAARQERRPPLETAEREGLLPLSFAQERLWFLDRLEAGATAYTMAAAFRLDGPLDPGALEAAIAAAARRHESLRTRFPEVDGRPVQDVAPETCPVFLRAELTGLPPAEREAEGRGRARELAGRPFDLARGPLLRALLMRLGPRQHVLVLTLHHIVADGWSVGVLAREIGALYEAGVANRPVDLPPLPVQYVDYAAWQREWLTGPVLAAEVAWWRDRLAGAPPLLDLPSDRPRPTVQSLRGCALPVRVPARAAAETERLCRSRSVTPFMALLAALQAVLARWSGQEDLVIGTPVANRDRVEVEGLVGLFVNTLALRSHVAGDPSFDDLLVRVREATLAAFAHQELPFEKVVEALQPVRSLAHAPVFQVMLSLQEAATLRLELPGISASPVEVEQTTAKLDLHLALDAAPGGRGGAWEGAVEYATDLFDATTVTRLARRLSVVLEAAAERPERRLSELPLLDRAEHHQVLREWSGAGQEAPPAADALDEAFRRQAERTPDRVAVIAGERRLSYRELRRQAGRVAAGLAALGVEPEEPVGVLLGRSAEMVAAILGVLEAGGAYLPLDPAYPQARLAFMLADARVRLLLTESRIEPAVRTLSYVPDRVIDVHKELERAVPSARGPRPAVTRRHVAYLIYTSGSTGRPKGVAIRHGSAADRISWAVRAYGGESLAGVLATTSVCFDLSVFEIFAPLSCGGTVVLASHALAAAELPAAWEAVLINTVPSAMAELIREGRLPASLRVANLAGEPLTSSLADAVHGSGTVEALYNLYGPSEDTTYSTGARLAPGGLGAPPIGRPLPGTRSHVLDRSGRAVPAGAPGDLHLGGAGLARGYHRRPGLTAERFVPDPFGAGPGERLYRTGDLVRHRADGEIHYLGRLDHQVKLRGFRIELGEVEAALLGHEGVREAVAVVRDGDSESPRLIAYYAPRAGAPPESVVQAVRDRLPGYMVPYTVVAIEALPRTPNGKVDRNALPSPDGERPLTVGEYVAPRNALEETLASIVAELLGVDRVGAFDDFFDLGGHSLQGIRLVAQVRRRFGVELELRRLFETPTVAGLSVAIVEKLVEAAEAVDVEAAFGELGGASGTGGEQARSSSPTGSKDVLDPIVDGTT